MGIDLTGFKVVYKEKVLRALALGEIYFAKLPECGETKEPNTLSVVALNESGNVVSICDEAWMFQFIPIVRKEG